MERVYATGSPCLAIAQESEGVQGRRKIAVKVVDIFGNDTMTIVEVVE